MQGRVTGGPHEVVLKLWKSCACPSSFQGAQHSSPCSPPLLSDAVYQEPALAGVLGRRPGVAHTVFHITKIYRHSFQLAHKDGVLPNGSRIRTLHTFVSAAAPPRSHSFFNSTPPTASWHHSNSCSKFSQDEGKRDNYSRSLSLLSLSLSLLSPSHLILCSAFFCVSESSNSSSILLFSL